MPTDDLDRPPSTSVDDARRWWAWLQASPVELVGLAVLLAGALTLTGMLWWSATQRPSTPASAGDAVPSADLVGRPASEVSPDAEHDGVRAHEHGDGAGGAGHLAPHTGGGETAGPAPDHGQDPEAIAAAPPPGPLTVHVSGAVGSPGLVVVPGGARTADAVAAAGGPSAEADLERINLARPVSDGEHVHVPRPGEDWPPGFRPPADGAGGAALHGATAGDDAGGAVTGGSAPGAGSAPLVDLNLADVTTLETLPGIGPSKAAAIVRHRETVGPFRVPGDVRDVSGIGEATFQRLADLVTVG